MHIEQRERERGKGVLSGARYRDRLIEGGMVEREREYFDTNVM